MIVPKVYDEEIFESYEVKLFDSNCGYQPKVIAWIDEYGDPYCEENLNSINQSALEEGYETFEIIRKIDDVLRYQVVDENESNEE